MAELKEMARMDSEIMSDETFETMLEALQQSADSTDVNELLSKPLKLKCKQIEVHDLERLIGFKKVMNENRIISHEEAENIMMVEGSGGVIKCGLPPSVRPSDPENKTEVEACISMLLQNDPSLTEINLNNMKRTPIPQIQRLIAALKDNSHLKKLSLANTGLTDNAAEPLLEMLEANKTLEFLNLETNFLSGDFLAKFFKSALKNQTLREVKCVNQSTAFSTDAEKEMMEYIYKNEGLTKVSANLRHPEARNKIEKATLRNGEIKRQQRRIEAAQKVSDAENAAKQAEEAAKKAEESKKAAEEKEKKTAAKPKSAEAKPMETKSAKLADKKADPKGKPKIETLPADKKAEPKPNLLLQPKQPLTTPRPKTPTYGYGSSKK